jgi:phosphomevalonate kinase
MKRKTSKEEYILIGAISAALLFATLTLIFFSHTINRIMNQGLGGSLVFAALILIVVKFLVKRMPAIKRTINDVKFIIWLK